MALVAPLSPLGQLSSALSLAAAGQIPATAFGPAVAECLAPVEASGVLHPDDARDLRRLAEGETLQPGRLAEIAARTGLLHAIASPQVSPQDVRGMYDRYLSIVGGSIPSLLPPSLAPRTSRIIQLRPQAMEDKIYCPVCSFPNREKAKFCDECGMPLVEMPEIDPGERDMTFAFTDLKGFDDFSRGLPPKVLFRLMNEILAGLGAVAAVEGGHVVGSWGDAIFVAFGTPDKPMEDHPIRAVRAALKMQEFIKTWSTKQIAQGRKGLELRVGVNTGTVAWGVLGLPGQRGQNGMGEEINVAARLEPIAYLMDAQKAKHGGIAISDATAERLAGRFETVSMGETTVKTRTVRFHLVTSERAQASELAQKGSEQVRFVGRSAEMDALRRHFASTVADKKQKLVVVSGEAGLGKTRLGSEFIDEVGRSGTDVSLITMHGEDLPAVPPYRVIARALERQAGIAAHDTLEDKRLKLTNLVHRTVAETDSDLELTTQLLGNLLGIDFVPPHPLLESLERNPEDFRERTLDAVVTYFDHLSQRRPVLMVVEDLHWVDRGTVRYLEVLLGRLKDRPFCVVGLTRPEFFKDDPAILHGDYSVEQIELGVLPRANLESMAEEILGTAPTAEVIEFLVKESRGNPYILQEMARSIRAGWHVDGELGNQYLVAPDGRRVPGGAHGFLQARVDHLPEAQRLLLRAASVVGAEFSIEELEAMGLKGTGEPLTELVRQTLLIPVDDETYQFPHALLRETVYGQIPETERQALHRGVATRLTTVRPDDFALIASHLERGGQNEQAALYYFRAAESAAKVGAFRTAASFHEKTFVLSGDNVQQIKALSGWDEALFLDRQYKVELPLLERFEEILKEIPSGHREVMAEARYHMGQILTYNGRLDDAERQITEGLSLYGADESSPNKCSLLSLLGTIYYRFRIDYAKTRIIYTTQVAAAKKIGDRRLQAMALFNIVRIELYTGNYSEALAAAKEVAESFKALGDQKMVLRSMNAVASISMMIGEYDQPLEILDEAIKLSRERVNGFHLDALLVTYCEGLISLGRYDEAFPRLEEALSTHEGHASNEFTSYTHSLLALAYGGKGDWPRALTAAEKGLQIIRSLGDDSEMAKSLAVLAHVHLGAGRIPEAVATSDEAIRIFERIGTINQFDEKLLLIHVKVLISAGRHQDALARAGQAKRLVEERALRIADETQRRSFLSSVPETREIMRLWQILREETSTDIAAPIKELLDRLDFFPPDTLPNEVLFAAGEKVGKMNRQEGEHTSAAGAVLNVPLASVLASLLSKTVKIDKNPGEVEGVWAKNIRWEPFFSQDGTLYSRIDWEVASRLGLHKIVFPLIGQQTQRQELLRGNVFSQNGAVVIELARSPGANVTSIKGVAMNVDPDIRPRRFQFGNVRFILVPTADNKTILVVEMGRGLYTQNPWNFLKAFVASIHQSIRNGD